MKVKQIEIPEELYSEFIEVLYISLLNIKETDENKQVRYLLMYLIEEAVKNEDVLIVDNKIVNRKKFLNV